MTRTPHALGRCPVDHADGALTRPPPRFDEEVTDVDSASAPELQRLARLVTGQPRDVLTRLLMLVCEQLAMEAAVVAALTGRGERVVHLAVRADGRPLHHLQGRSDPLADTWCAEVVQDGGMLVPDVAARPDLAHRAGTAGQDVGSFAGAVLRGAGGSPVGTLVAYRTAPHPSLNPRDQQALDALAEVATPLLQRIDGPPAPAPRPLPDLASVAGALSAAHDVEQISRPLLDALHELTGLASSYLTVIHREAGQQEIRFARNTRPGFTIPEGLHVPWDDTLCKRALDEGRPCVTDVPGVWGDSEAAAAIGIQVYVSVPVELADGQVWGTLCAADAVPACDAEVHVPTMRLFARLIAAEVDRAVALTAERHRAAEARKAAETDALTGCASRRVVEPWLVEQLAQLAPHEALLLAYADIDAFKQVNDGRGHAAGDAVLVEVGRRLREAARPDDLVARLGGDEFLVAARLPALAAPAVEERLRDLLSFELSWQGESLAVSVSVGCTTSRGGEAGDLLAAADRSMYARKRRDSSPAAMVLLSS